MVSTSYAAFIKRILNDFITTLPVPGIGFLQKLGSNSQRQILVIITHYRHSIYFIHVILRKYVHLKTVIVHCFTKNSPQFKKNYEIVDSIFIEQESKV